MSARDDIVRLLDQWRQLSQAEASAIQSASWPDVRKIQTAKADLQKALELARKQWVLENPAPAAPAPFQSQVAHLISLEARNADLLAGQQARARAEQSTLDQTNRTVRKIQRSYTTAASSSAWQGYS